MEQTNNQPDPEQFTKEIEDTIEDLFAPAKQIEIDPLTNEIKELSQTEEVEAPLGLDFGEGDQDTSETTPKPDVSPGGDLELDLDLDFDEEEVKQVNETEENRIHRFNQLYQALLTLEWEVNRDNIHAAKDLLEGVASEFKLIEGVDGDKVLSLMRKTLSKLAEDPESVPTTAPKVLQKVVEAVIGLQSGENGVLIGKKQSLEDAIVELEGLQQLEKTASYLSEEEAGDQQESLASEYLDMELELQPDEVKDVEPASVELEEVSSQGIVEPKEVVEAVSDTPFEEDAKTEQSGPGEKIAESLISAVNFHVAVLDDCIENLRPVESLLKKTRGLEKLYRFHVGLRTRLEEQKGVLLDVLGGKSFTPPVYTRFFEAEGDIPEKTEQKSPWKELALARWEGREVGFLPEEIGFIGTTRLNLSEFKGKSTFPLKKLKKWPWSKLRPLFVGELSGLTEEELKGLELPVISSPEPSSICNENNSESTMLVLYSGDRGCVLFVDEQPRTVSIPDDWSWEPGKDSDVWKGFLKGSNGAIPVATLESLTGNG